MVITDDIIITDDMILPYQFLSRIRLSSFLLRINFNIWYLGKIIYYKRCRIDVLNLYIYIYIWIYKKNQIWHDTTRNTVSFENIKEEKAIHLYANLLIKSFICNSVLTHWTRAYKPPYVWNYDLSEGENANICNPNIFFILVIV